MLASNMLHGILDMTSVILFAGKSWGRTRAMFSSNRKIHLALNIAVNGATFLGLSRTFLAILKWASHAVTRMLSMLFVVTLWLTVIECEDSIVIGSVLLSITCYSFGRTTSMYWVIDSIPNRI